MDEIYTICNYGVGHLCLAFILLYAYIKMYIGDFIYDLVIQTYFSIILFHKLFQIGQSIAVMSLI